MKSAELFIERFGVQVAGQEQSKVRRGGDGSWIQTTWELLFLTAEPKQKIEDLVPCLQLKLETARKILERAANLAELRSPTGSDFLFIMEETKNGDNDEGTKVRLCYPPQPRSLSAKRLVNDYAAKLETFVKSDSDLARRVLNHYAHNLVPGTLRVSFEAPMNVEMVNAYVSLLVQMGFQRRSLKFRGSDGSELPKTLRPWLNKSDPLSEHLSECQPVNDGDPSNCRKWTVEPHLGVGNSKLSTTDWEQALGFVMLLGAIRFG